MATRVNTPLAGEIWHLSIEDLFAPVEEPQRLGGEGPFVINLSVSTAPINVPKKAFDFCPDAYIYQIQVTEDGRMRYRLRLGSFLYEDEADAVLQEVRETYPAALTATACALDVRTIDSMQARVESKKPHSRKPAKASADKAAAERQAAERAAAEIAAAERAVADSIAAERAAQKLAAERLAAERATAERAAQKLAAERAAAERALQKLAAEQAAAERAAAERADAERLAAERAAAERALQKRAAERAAAERLAAERAAAERAAQKLAAERAAAERAAAERAAAERAAAERLAAERAAAERAAQKLAAEKAAAERAAAERLAAERAAAERAAQKLAAEKAAAEKAAAERAAAERAAAERLAAERAAAERAAQKLAAEKAAAERAAAERAAAERLAAERAAAERAAQKLAAEKAAAERAAAERAAAERLAAEKAAAQKAAAARKLAAEVSMDIAFPPVAAPPAVKSAPLLTQVVARILKTSPPAVADASTPAPLLTEMVKPVRKGRAGRAPKAAAKAAAEFVTRVVIVPAPKVPEHRAVVLSHFAPTPVASAAPVSPPRPAAMPPTMVAMAAMPVARQVKQLNDPLPDLESTQTVRALTPPELEDHESSRWFVIQLALADRAFDPEAVPNLDIFSEYRLYSVSGVDQGRTVHALRLGFFTEEIAAVMVASYLGAHYDKPSIRRISVAERERFAHQRVEARKNVGETGTHAVIEITDELVARRKRIAAAAIPETSTLSTGDTGLFRLR